MAPGEEPSRDRRPRGRYWDLWRHRAAAAVLAGFVAAALGADLLASRLPLAVVLDGQRYWLPCVTHPIALRGVDNAMLARLPRARVRGLWLPPVPFGPNQTDITTAPLSRPSRTHWLGTDQAGRDVMARVIHGARVSLAVGLLATALAAVLGLGLGALAGFVGGGVDAVLDRLMEVVQTFPVFFLLLCVMALVPRAGVGVLIAVLGGTRWIEMGRLARAEAMRVRALDYVAASRAMGASERRTFAIHVLPSAAGPVWISASLAVGSMVLMESALSFLGFGIPPPTASWGELLSQARAMPSAWWLSLAPGLCIFAVVAACNVLGEGLREARGGRLPALRAGGRSDKQAGERSGDSARAAGAARTLPGQNP